MLRVGPYALALQPDGKAILAGRVLAASSGSFALARYTTSGSLDPTFGNGGKVFTSVGKYSGAAALFIQPDGKIIAGGESWNGDFALVRYNPDGSLDRSFGTNGIATTPFPGSLESWIVALSLDSEGRILAVGNTCPQANGGCFPVRFALARYMASGALDHTFGSGGRVTTKVGPYSAYAHAGSLQPDGKIIAAGGNGTSQGGFGLVRYDENGTLDPTFGDGGIVSTQPDGVRSDAAAIALQPDGKIVAAGSDYTESPLDVVRYQVDGSLDPTFGTNGIVSSLLWDRAFAATGEASALALNPSGNILVAGVGDEAPKLTGPGFLLVRYLGTPNCLVPNLKGRRLPGARRALSRDGCSAGQITYVFSTTFRRGRVLRQSLTPHSVTSEGTAVDMTVSKRRRH